ncbi:MAG: TPM domain-containing protein [Endomicrobia bacterium]|nr:TPM domain-containing protein [Endomicrobiia bacterium]
MKNEKLKTFVFRICRNALLCFRFAKTYKSLILNFSFLIFCYMPLSAEINIPSKPYNSIYVQDYAGVLSADISDKINTDSEWLEKNSKAQIAVVTVNSLDGALIEDFSLEILREWGIGDRELNNGVLILVAVGDRESRIEVGYGLEGALTDAKTGRIQDEYMLPYFREGKYGEGIINGYIAVLSEVLKEYNLQYENSGEPVKPGSDEEIPLGIKIFFLLFFIMFIIVAVKGNKNGRGGGRGRGGGTYRSGGGFRSGSSSGGGRSSFGGGSGGGGGSSRKW